MVGFDSQEENIYENICTGNLKKEVSSIEVIFSSYSFPGDLLGVESGKDGWGVII